MNVAKNALMLLKTNRSVVSLRFVVESWKAATCAQWLGSAIQTRPAEDRRGKCTFKGPLGTALDGS